MTAAAALAAGRAAAEREMRDTCTISLVTGVATDANGDTSDALTTLYAGKCRVQTFEPQERNPDAAGATFTVQRYSVHVPVARTVADYKPAPGHVIDITAAANDPHLVGRRFRVVALLHKTNATAYRLGVEEVL